MPDREADAKAILAKYAPANIAVDSPALAGLSTVMNVWNTFKTTPTSKLKTAYILKTLRTGTHKAFLSTSWNCSAHPIKKEPAICNADQYLYQIKNGTPTLVPSGYSARGERRLTGHRGGGRPPSYHMSSYILFLMIGLGAGAIYAMLGLGLVLKHRSAGVIDFAHCAVAMWCAYVYIELHPNGELVFPWAALRAHPAPPPTGLRPVAAILVALAYSAVLGLIFYYASSGRCATRPRSPASAPRRLDALPGGDRGPQLRDLRGLLAADSAGPRSTSAGLVVPSDRLYLAGIAVLIGLGLGRSTATRASGWRHALPPATNAARF